MRPFFYFFCVDGASLTPRNLAPFNDFVCFVTPLLTDSGNKLLSFYVIFTMVPERDIEAACLFRFASGNHQAGPSE